MACLFSGCILGILFVLLIFSPGNICPANTDWVINGGGDNLQHYLGWRFFRNSPWTRYLLFMKNWNYPVGTSVIVTDSNPLFCLFFKLIGKILPDTFQFNGIWILTSYLLLALFSGLIGWRLTHHFLLTLTGTVLALLNPVILQRALIHDTLTAHWLILAAVWLALNDDKKLNPAGWFILTEITLLIHVYFIPMLIFVFSLQLVRMFQKKRTFGRIFFLVSVLSAAILSGYFMFGYSLIEPQSGSYGELSMNLNAFINPDGVSSVIKSRPTLPLQYEGFNYLGLGLLLLSIIAFVFGIRYFRKRWLFYLIPTSVLILFAVSNNAYFDLNQVFHIELPERVSSVLSVFRSSGRLAWPVYYLVLFGSLRLISATEYGKRTLCFAVLLCAAIQIIDLKDFCMESARRFRSPQNQIADIPPELSGLMENVSHLYVSDGDAKSTDALALFAVEHQMTFNKCTNARGTKRIFGGDELDMNQLTCSRVRADSAFIYLSGNYPVDLEQCGNAVIEKRREWVLIRYREE